MREKHWRRYELLFISGHISMVNVLFWWLTISRYGGSWGRISLLTSKRAKWALLFEDYNFEVVHRVGITNLDADGISRNWSPSDEDLTGAMWHGGCDLEAVPGWHAAAYFTLFFGADVEVPIQGSDDETDQPQAIADILEDLPVLQKLQQGTFPSFTSAMERDMIGHRITRFRWENGLLFWLWLEG